VGHTLTVRQVRRNPKTIDIAQLATEINEGRVKQLFIFGGDPVYNAPRGLVEDPQTKMPLDWADLQKKVPNIFRLGYHEDATSALSQWHIPLAHYLESWGDALTAGGDSLSAPTPQSPEIVLTGSYGMDDGRYASNGWLQELPDPVTKLSWDNAALISPAYAKTLGVETGDLLQIAINEKSASGTVMKRELVIAALVSP